jgi:hypothetical protein
LGTCLTDRYFFTAAAAASTFTKMPTLRNVTQAELILRVDHCAPALHNGWKCSLLGSQVLHPVRSNQPTQHYFGLYCSLASLKSEQTWWAALPQAISAQSNNRVVLYQNKIMANNNLHHCPTSNKSCYDVPRCFADVEMGWTSTDATRFASSVDRARVGAISKPGDTSKPRGLRWHSCQPHLRWQGMS